MKQIIIAGIIGSFIGYALFVFINGVTNNYFYKCGLKTGLFINKILLGAEMTTNRDKLNKMTNEELAEFYPEESEILQKEYLKIICKAVMRRINCKEKFKKGRKA